MKLNNLKILVTGAAGFIGSYLSKRLLEISEHIHILGLDNLNNYYDVELKKARVKMIEELAVNHDNSFQFVKGDISDKEFIDDLFIKYQPDIVVNLAAQAGVRYSISNPRAYIDSNIIGFFNILEACRNSYANGATGVLHFVYASSSSVYGLNEKIPYSTTDQVDHPISLYAATKKSNELMAHAYSKLYGIPSTGLRFFTVYGPMGRPDMAYFQFANKMVKGEKIQIFNHGDMYRDFTYIDDIITGIVNVIEKPPKENENGIRYKIYNIGNNKPENLMYFVETLKKCLKEEGMVSKPIEMELLPMQPGDVYQTYADVDELVRDFNFKPETPLEVGLSRFASWYKKYYIQL